MTDNIRVRFAPSPTGSLHIGGARLVMYNVLFAHGQAKREGKTGKFILRIEDTDRKRLIEGSVENLMDGLRWLGLEWDEGPDVGGPYAPYVQSERKHRYGEVAEQLVTEGKAYRCFCSAERLQEVREAQQKAKMPPGYDRHCRNLSADDVRAKIDAGETFVIRFAMPLDGQTIVPDLLRGDIVYENNTIDDLVIQKSDGFPTYHLAVVVDDHEMDITHITRGPEWIPTAPLHVQLYKALGWDMPIFAHMPLILNANGGKLSKRHGGVSLNDFREGGYLPEALLNYFALLGWSLDGKTEIYSFDDLLEHFTLEKVSPSPSTFDRQKLDWLNAQWINHHLTTEDLALRVMPWLIDAGMIEDAPADADHPQYATVVDLSGLLKDRIHLLTEAPDLMSFFLVDELPDYDAALLVPKKVEPAQAKEILDRVALMLPNLNLGDLEQTELAMRELAENMEMKPGQVFMPIRVAATGRTQSPGLFETLAAVGKDRMIERVDLARKKLSA